MKRVRDQHPDFHSEEGWDLEILNKLVKTEELYIQITHL
jgi:hypothetical protein